MSPDSEKLDPYVQKVILGLWKREQNKGKGKGKDKTKDDADEDLANVEVYDYSPNKFLINLGVIFVLAQIYVISTSPDEIQPMQIRASIVFAVLWFLKG